MKSRVNILVNTSGGGRNKQKSEKRGRNRNKEKVGEETNILDFATNLSFQNYVIPPPMKTLLTPTFISQN